MAEQIVVAAFVILGAIFAGLVFGVSWLLSPTKPDEGKTITYESGVDTIGPPWIRFRAGYYVYAILYVIFDIETIFLFPWAVAMGSEAVSWFFFIEMIIFMSILVAGLAYAWKEGAFKWH